MKILLVAYLILLLLLAATFCFVLFYGAIDLKSDVLKLAGYCLSLGIIGGVVHCLRSVYLHKALLADWNANWNAWYFIRPIVSGTVGIISMIFIKAGLLIFTSNGQIDDRIAAYLAVAFVAGYNVKNFLLKIEEVSQTVLGIEKKKLPDGGEAEHGT
jgi:hypothetical protein